MVVIGCIGSVEGSCTGTSTGWSVLTSGGVAATGGGHQALSTWASGEGRVVGSVTAGSSGVGGLWGTIGRGQCIRSSSMDLGFVGWCTGMNFRRNRRFHRVCLPDPSILTRYWCYWHTSITTPVRSHLLG